MTTNKSETSSKKYFFGVGRRKSCSARCKYYPENQELEILVNKKPLSEYFPDFYAKNISICTANIGIKTGRMELFIRGGGLSGQSEAAIVAIAKSILAFDEALKPIIRTFGYITTDIRKVLPKRSGLRKNRKREQWSKR